MGCSIQLLLYAFPDPFLSLSCLLSQCRTKLLHVALKSSIPFYCCVKVPCLLQPPLQHQTNSHSRMPRHLPQIVRHCQATLDHNIADAQPEKILMGGLLVVTPPISTGVKTIATVSSRLSDRAEESKAGSTEDTGLVEGSQAGRVRAVEHGHRAQGSVGR